MLPPSLSPCFYRWLAILMLALAGCATVDQQTQRVAHLIGVPRAEIDALAADVARRHGKVDAVTFKSPDIVTIEYGFRTGGYVAFRRVNGRWQEMISERWEPYQQPPASVAPPANSAP